MSEGSFRKRIFEVTAYFFRLGLLGFGGPLSLIAMMQEELVEKRQWISSDEFKQVFALIKAMPGPVAFQTAVFLGRRRAGLLGGTTAAIGIILPAAILIVGFGYYINIYSGLRVVQFFLTGMQVAAVVTILIGLKSFFVPHLRQINFWLLFVVSALIFYFHWLPEAVLIIGGAALWAFGNRATTKSDGLGMTSVFAFVAADPKLFDLVSVCVKAGAIVFGTGLAIVPILEQDFVERLHWMTHAEFMNALALGQITPGPVMISATYIGFKTFGLKGAVVATLAVFGPSFFHMMTWFNSAIQFLSRQYWVKDFVFAATSIIMGTIAVTTAAIMAPWVAMPWCFGLFAIVMVAGLKLKWPAWALIPIGGVCGLLASFLF